MARGNRKAPIFEDAEDCRQFLDLLSRMAARYRFRVYAACLMVNHYHIVGETPLGNVAHGMRFLNGSAQASNRRHRRTGHVFEARYRSLVVQRESYLKRAVRYVVLNPVRARLVTAAAAWPWTTYRATAGLETPPEWLSLDWLEWAFRADSRLEATRRYQQYVEQPAPARAAINTRAFALGGRAFRERMANWRGHRRATGVCRGSMPPCRRPPLSAATGGGQPHAGQAAPRHPRGVHGSWVQSE